MLEKFEGSAANLLMIRPGWALAFILESAPRGTVIYRSGIPWGTDRLPEAIGAALGTDRAVAERLYELYRAGDVSDAVRRSIERILRPVVEELFKKIEKTRFHGKVYVDTTVALPSFLPARRGRVQFAALPLGEMLSRFGFSIDALEWPDSDSSVFRSLAPFFEFYYDKSDSPINQRLWRRLHWLGKRPGEL